MEERELTVDDLATRADEGDVSYFAYGGPVGEDMATEMQPSVSYFADGGSVDAQMLSIPDRPQYVGPSASAVQGPTAAQMLQSFADGGLVDSAAARMAIGAPAENLFGANLAAPKPVAAPNYTFNLPTFNPTPVNFGGVTNPAAPALTFAGTQQVTPAPGAKTLYEQIAPSTFAAAPYDFSKAATSFTPTAQTFAKPTLLSAEEAIKQQPVLVRYQPDIKFGGLQTYQGPLQTSPYKDEEPSAPAQGPVGIGGLPTAATPAITRTPLGYEYSPYATLTPEQIAGSGNRAQITDMFKGIVTQQQKDVDNLRIEYNQAMAVGNMPLANQLKGILTAQEQELATAKADQLNANKYFTGVGGAFETPEMLRQRVLGEQFKALKLGDELAFRGVDLGGIQVAAGAKADPFTAELTRQQNEATAAQNVYNRLVGAYGKDSQIAKDYLSQTLTPQQQEYQNMLALTRPAKGAVAPTNIFSAITAGEAYKGFTAPKLAEIRNVVQTENVYKPIITGFETNINNLVRAREQADSLGLSGYSNRLNQLIETETAKLEQARGERQSAIDRAQPDPMRDYILGKQMTNQKIDSFIGMTLEGVDFGKLNASEFDKVIQRQDKDKIVAEQTYNQLKGLYGDKSDVVKNFYNEVLIPQTKEYNDTIGLKRVAESVIGSYNTGKNYNYLNPPAISVTKSTSDATINKAYDDFIRNNYEKRIATLDAAKAKAEQAGLGQYGDYFNQLMDTQRSYIDRTNQARDALFAKRDAATRAKGSPPEGEVADSRSRALLKKLSGGGEATTAPLQKFAKGGAVKKAAELLKGLGVSEGKVAGKELTTLQDAHTSLGDAVRERATKSKQMMDAMEFKYGPGQYVFTESSAKKNLSPLEIKAKRLYGDQPVRETPASKASRDPVTGKVLRTPYEPGYLVRQQMPEGDWAEYVIPESAIKGTVDGFGKGGTVKKAASALTELVEAPSVALRGKLAEIEKYLSEKYGTSEAKRLQRAADEVKNLEDQYTTEALQEVFRGDNTKPLLVVADPASFQDFAARLKEPYRPAVERYWREMSPKGGGAGDVPYLRLNKDIGKLPFVSGHEGRHRNLAMQELGYPSTIWQIMTQGELREPLRRRTREEYLKDLFDLIGERPLVIPESRWTPETKDTKDRVRDWKKARNLPEPFKHGGTVDGFGKGGAVKKAASSLSEFLAESKVKDRLYHATPKDITEFIPGGDNPKRSGPAIWMTPNKEFQPAAHNIRQVPDKPGYMYGSSSNMFTPGTNVMPLYANIKKPLIATEKNWKEVFKGLGGDPWSMSESTVNKLKERGHDGVFYYNNDGVLEEVVVFDPTQVKSAIGNRGTYNPKDPDIRKAKGGLVYRAQGSPVYGEMPDTGPITEDTRAAMRGSGKFSASEAARMLRNIAGEGVSNIESLLRGSVAAIPGSVGDIESIFRESDKTRKFATTEEVLRDYMPGRVTKPTKEAAGMEEVGSYLPLPVPAGTATKVAKGVKTGARKALEELGPTAATMLERTIPKMNIVPEGPGLPTNLSERIDQGKFFKGRLDDFVSQIRNPVTKEQFLGSLKGKFREYEISRAAQALEDLDNAAKLSPTDLVSRINTVAAPNRYKTTFIEPKTSGLHNNYDNVYGQTGQPIGVINLSYEPTRAAIEAEEASAAARSAAAALGRSKVNDPEKIQTLMSFLETSSDLAKDPERKAQLIAGLSKLDSQLSAAREEITPLAEGLTDIMYGNIPEFKSYTDKLREATKNISFPRGTPEYSEAFKNVDDQVLSEIRIEALQRLYQEQPSLRTFLPLKEGETFDDLVQSLGGTKYVAQEVLPRMRKNMFERLDDTTKAILVDNKPLLEDILTETQRSSTYKGSHAAVNPEKNPMGFSRFSEHQVNVPGMGKLDGIYVSELQSDMFRDIKKLGKKGGSAAKDREELTSLFSGIKSKLEPLRPQIEERFGSMDSFLFILRGDLTDKPNTANFSEFLTQLGPINKGKADQLATDLVKDVKRITKLQDRLGLPGKEVKGTYDIEEPIANIEVQPQVVQQLLAKNAIAGALKMGKDFVAFPGAESKQAKLYEKLPRNLDAVLKDLGEGFTKQAITIKDATGTERQHWAVIWDKNAAQRVLNNGVPFKKGGLVEKSKVDNRRYI